MMQRVPGAAGGAINLAAAALMIAAVTGCTSSETLRLAPTSTAAGAVPSTAPPVLNAEQLALLERRNRREDELLSEPLTAESAAEIALLHNPIVARALETLGIPDVDRLLVAHTVNPAFNRGRAPDTADTRIERSLSVNLMTWLIIPALAPSNSIDERTARVQAADEIASLLFAARRAWISAVAARQAVRYFEDVLAATEASREIIESMRSVGNASELETLRAQQLHADAVTQLTSRQVAAALEHERLIQTLGLWGVDAERVQLPERLPDLPRAAIGPDGLEARAVAQRFDVQVGRRDGLAGEAGANARAELRASWLAYRGAHDLAQHARDALVPLANRVSAEQLKLYNGMLVGVFDLVADATERINAVNAALEAERDFWLAEVELQRAMSGVGVPALTLQAGAPSGFRPGARYHVH
jgi:outer membrane protein TolC